MRSTSSILFAAAFLLCVRLDFSSATLIRSRKDSVVRDDLSMSRKHSFPTTLLLPAPEQIAAEPGFGVYCAACQELLVPALKELGSNVTDNELVTLLEKVCDLIPISSEKKRCLSGVDSIPTAVKLGGATLLQKYSVRAVCSILGLCEVDCCLTGTIPEQIKLALTNVTGQIRVTWTTRNYTVGLPTVAWDIVPPPGDARPLNKSSPTYREISENTTYTFTTNTWRGYMHTLIMDNLQPGVRYYYQVGDSAFAMGHKEGYWSQPVLSFVGPKAPNENVLSGMLVGDMGGTDVSDKTVFWMNAQIMENLTPIEIVLHVGDISYADMNEVLDDDFCRKIEPVASAIPYMTIPGNHEAFFEFSAYANRWNMPLRTPGDLFYSYNYGPVHFIAMNTEANNDMPGNFGPGTAQYAFLQQDLAQAAAQRATQPWIVVLTHRPFYCMTATLVDCNQIGAQFRSWVEDMFNQYKVDLVISAHRHDYERSYPMYKSQPTSQNYNNPQNPVYLINGAAGNQEHADSAYSTWPSWLAAQSSAYGYSIFNATMNSMTWSFYGSDKNTLIDTFTITKS